MPSTENKTALAFLAHPDDAEFHCGGTLIRLADAGWDVHICTVANGDCGTTSETPWSIAGIRTKEADRAAKLIGGTYHCIGERDGMVVYDRGSIQKALDLFRRVTPSLVFIHPRQDYMMDHEMSSLLGRAASFLFGAPNASEFPLSPGSKVPHLYYCDPVEARDHYGNVVTPTTYVDITAVLDRKTEMLACHASQREWLRAHHGEDEYLHSMQRSAAMRGAQVGVAAAEGFVQHRGHAYPRNDLLEELFGKPDMVA
ncbi:MAG: PIG-L family deacetylase [Thermoguttaceae bacterium]|jgi:LmbE family N-acetylglucosaminyl deacetylase|nr:PIG-L family deacetylase [Thermoguttaceae bacterium]